MAVANLAIRVNAQTDNALKAFEGMNRAFAQFEKQFEGVTKAIQANQQRMNASFASFSGDKLIREALDYAAAVERIGGAAKLTEAEQRKVNATVTEALAKYKALGQDAPASLQNLARATAQLTQPTTLASRAVSGLSGLFGQFTAANLAASAIQSVTGKVSEFVAQGAKLPGLEASFERLTSGLGQNSREMLSSMQGATRGLVSNIDLMQSANKAILLGLPVTTKEMGELAKTATVLGKAMGQDATKSFDDLITALGRSSPLILDNLGLTVKVGQANETYARELGKTVEAMTDVERKMAFYNAAMEKARQKVQELGEQTLTLGEMTNRIWVGVGNNVTQTVADINVGLGAQISSFQELIRLAAQYLGLRKQIADVERSTSTGTWWWNEMKEGISVDWTSFVPLLNQYVANMRLAAEAARAATDAQARFNTIVANAPKPEDIFRLGGPGSRPNQFGQDLLDVNQYLNEHKRLQDKAKPAAAQHAEALRAVNQKIVDLTRGTRDLSDEHKRSITSFTNLGLSVNEVALKLGLSEVAVKAYTGAEKARTDATTMLAAQSVAAIDWMMNEQTRLLRLGAKDAAAEALAYVKALNTMRDVTVGLPKLPGVELPMPKLTKAQETILDREAKRIQERYEQTFGKLKKATEQLGHDIAGTLADNIRSGDWSQFENQMKGALSEFMGSAIAAGINAVVPGLGNIVQPLLSALSDKFLGALGLGTKGRDLVKDFAAGFVGGFNELNKRLTEAGRGDLWIKLTQGVGRDNPKQAAAAIKEVQAALDAFGTEAERAERRLNALGSAIEGVNKKAELFAAPFRKLLESRGGTDGDEFDAITRKMQATAQAGQAEFERLGIFVGATFAGMVKETGDVFAAITALSPAFKVLQQGVNEFGLTSTGVIDQLLATFGLITDEVTGPILQSIQATGQIFAGLQDAGHMTADLFQIVGADIGAAFRELEARGGDVARAMALSQPVLQRLWEAQRTYGAITDETTAKLLKQAEEQGLVGAHMQDVNQKILDVLIAIADVFGAVLPESFRKSATAARSAAREIEDSFSRIDIPPIKIDIEYNDPGFVGSTGSLGVPKLGSGGIVRRPTLALVGEAGPEAVVPLEQLGRIGRSGGGTGLNAGPLSVGPFTIMIPPGELTRAMKDGTPIVVQAINDNHQGAHTQLFGRGEPLGVI